MNVLLLAASFCAVALGGTPIVLDEKNFVHDTQIGSGMTTGAWFIKFYAPWCGHCKKMAPAWEALVDDLKGDVNVAEVDATQNRNLMEQFGIKGFPTLLFFKDGYQYKYQGPRSQEALAEFARGGYRKVEAILVPGPMSFPKKLMYNIKNTLTETGTMVLIRPKVSVTLLFVGVSIGMGLGSILTVLLAKKPARKVKSTPSSETTTTKKTAETTTKKSQ